jgi:hypothetical protein
MLETRSGQKILGYKQGQISLKSLDFRNVDLGLTKLSQNGFNVKSTEASVITKRNTIPNKNY